jgi:hypothetical protein
MYLSYLDSSARPDYNDPENFVVSSITVNEHQWYSVRGKIEDVKKKHFPHLSPENVEFHAKDMINRTGIYRKLAWAQIYEILDDLFQIISDPDTKISIIASLIVKSKLRKQIDLEEWGHRFVFERLNSYLNEQNEFLASAGMPHEYGIMIMDTEGHKKDQKLRDKLSDMLNNGTFYSKLEYLIEDPLFTDSKWRNLSQITDCVCYCIRKHFRNNSNNLHKQNWDKYFKLIEPKFHHKDGNYHGYGLKIFP